MANKKFRVRDGIEANADIVTTANMTATTFNGALNGNATTATRLRTGRAVTISGDGAATTVFDGTSAVTLALALTPTGVTAGTYRSVTVDATGRVLSGTNPSTTLSGDVTGSGLTAITATLSPTGVVAGTYNTVTVDAKGRVTAASNVTIGQPGYTVIPMGNGDVTLTAEQQASGAIVLTGTNTATRYLNVLPGQSKANLSVVNTTTGGFSVVVRVLNGSGTVSVPNSGSRMVHSNGASVTEAVTAMGAVNTVGDNVGIGTRLPLNTAGYTALTIDNPAMGGVLDLRKNGVRIGAILPYNTNDLAISNTAQGAIYFANFSDPLMAIRPTGQVGIGNFSPLFKLAIEGDGGATSETETGVGTWQTGATWRNAALSIGNTNANGLRTWTLSTRVDGMFHIADETATRSRLRIDRNGNVEIGRNSSNLRLTVIGNARVTNLNAGSVGMVSGDANTTGRVEFFAADGTTRRGYLGRATTAATVLSADAGDLILNAGEGSSVGGQATLTKGGRLYISTGETIDIADYGFLRSDTATPTGHVIATTSAPVGLHVTNRAIAAEFNAYSDRRYKTDIAPITDATGLMFVEHVVPKTFTITHDASGTRKAGYIAQEVAKTGAFRAMIAPHQHDGLVAETDDDGFRSPANVGLSVNYLEAIPYLHAALRNALARIEELETKLAAKN